MWIEKQKTQTGEKKYKYVERFTDAITGKTVKLSVTLASKSRAAQKEAGILLAGKWEKRQNGISSPSKRRASALSQGMKLEKLLEEWQDYHAPTVRESTRKNVAYYAAAILRTCQEGITLGDFTPAAVERLLRRFYLEQGYSRGYAAGVLNTIKAVMRYAQKARYIESAAEYASIQLPRRPLSVDEVEKKGQKFLDRDELRQVIKELKAIAPRTAAICEFMALTGLRIGEALALRVCDYDKTGGYVDINGSISHNDGQKRTPPKNRYSVRKVQLSGRCMTILDALILENKQAARWSDSYMDRGYIFTRLNSGLPMSSVTIDRTLKGISLASGKRLSSHFFRHTHISMLAAANVPLRAIMSRVGHNSPDTTLKVYTHVTAEMQQKVKLAIEHI